MSNDLSVIKVYIVKPSLLSTSALIIVQTKAMARLLMGSDNKPVFRAVNLPYLFDCLPSSIFSLDCFVLCFDRYQHSLHLRSPRSTTAYTTFLSEVDLIWSKHLLLATGLAFLYFIFLTQKEKYIFSWLRLKINCLMPRLFICSSSSLAWLGCSFHLRIFLTFYLQICLLISNLIHHSNNSFRCSHLNGNRYDW